MQVRVSGGIRPRGPLLILAAGGGRRVAALKSAGAARKCRCVGGGPGWDRWCGSPPSVVFTGQGLTRSGRGGWGGGLRAPGAGRGRRPRSRSFSRRPLEGCGQEAAGALSMVRRGAARPAQLRALSPQVVLSRFQALALSP